MKLHSLAYLLLFVVYGCPTFACEDYVPTSVEYPKPQSYLEYEIDTCLSYSEECLFSNNFSLALTNVEKAENLLSLCSDVNDHRRLRCLFDKAVIVTCVEGDNDNSREQFRKFETLLVSKKCDDKKESTQPNLFDRNGNWPIWGESTPIGIGECLERVSSIEDSLAIACAGLNVSPPLRVAMEAAIYIIAKRAKMCCTEQGFWKNCIQPVVDSWKKVEIFGIPPDPYWD